MSRAERCAPRVRPREDEPIEIQVMSNHFLDIFEARDISATGVGLYVPYRFEDCDLTNPVTLVITLPGVRPFLTKGRVVHRSKTEREFFGIEFFEIVDEQREEIDAYISVRLAEDGEEDGEGARPA